MRRAFTIIEMLVAIALATAVIFTAFTAFRVAQRAVSTGNRLAAENSLLRAGYHFGMREIDGWDGTRIAQPGAFAALTPGVLNTIDNRPTEDWWHWPEATVAAPPPVNTWFGTATYQMPGLDPLLSAAQFQECRGFYPAVQVRENTLNTVGWYAYLSYLPYNALFTSQRGWLAGNNVWGGVDFGTGSWYHDFANATLWHTSSGGGRSRGGTSYITGSQTTLWGAALPTPDQAQLRNNLLDATVRPAHWPDLQVNVQRAYARARLIVYVEVNAKSPVTDQLLSLRFRTWGTTMRGARVNAGVANERAAITY